MALWAANGASANAAPKAGFIDQKILGNTAFGNVTVGAFRSNVALGVFAVDTAEMANVIADGVAHPGWVKVIQGTGPVLSITIVDGGTGYSNTDLVRVSGGVVNASATLTTNATGGIDSVTLTSGGSGFINVSSTTTAITNSIGGSTVGGTSGDLAAVLGGRSGRRSHETLVAMGSIVGDASDDTTFPDT